MTRQSTPVITKGPCTIPSAFKISAELVAHLRYQLFAPTPRRLVIVDFSQSNFVDDLMPPQFEGRY
jgi:hypothetical protein